MQMIAFAAAASLAVSNSWSGNDPFVGKWKLDVSQSTIVDDMRVEAVGPNRYRFQFEGAPPETILANGADQPGLPGTTLSVQAENARTLKVVRKQNGRVIASANWRLSRDGRTLLDSFTGVQQDGSRATTEYVYRRISGASGFAGTWESTTKPAGLKLELEIQPYKTNGLRFISPASDNGVIFDGKSHPVSGARDGRTLSGRRRGTRSIDYTEKHGGEIERVRQFDLSRDGRTLTEIVRGNGQTSSTRFVFERE